MTRHEHPVPSIIPAANSSLLDVGAAVTALSKLTDAQVKSLVEAGRR